MDIIGSSPPPSERSHRTDTLDTPRADYVPTEDAFAEARARLQAAREA